MSFFYNAVFLIYAVIAAPSFILKGKHKEGWKERLGNVPTDMNPAFKDRARQRVLWFHAVSVGEIKLASRLIREILALEPNDFVVLTTTTPSGKKIALEQKLPQTYISYIPFDLTFCLKKFLNALKPSLLVLMETEVWPNTIKECSTRGIPVMIINGRISDRAFMKYRKIIPILKNTFRKIHCCLTQSDEHRKRFIELGVLPDRARVTGNMKFDMDLSPSSDRDTQIFAYLKKSLNSRILLGASTHEGEEKFLINIAQELNVQGKAICLMLAPGIWTDWKASNK